MSQTGQLVDVLKKELKAQGKTYQDVADILELSEASVKRLFSDRNFTLDRLEKISHLLNLQMSDLFLKLKQQQQQLSRLSREQEKEIAGDLLLLLVSVSVISGMRFEEILSSYQISEAECIQKLAHLDRLKLIELLPGNRVKLLVAPNFNWLPNGPIQQFFQEKVEQDFFNSRFDKANEKLLVSNALLTDSSNALLQQKMQALVADFNQMMQEDSTAPAEKKHGTTMVLAIRQWQYSLFRQLSR